MSDRDAAEPHWPLVWFLVFAMVIVGGVIVVEGTAFVTGCLQR